jgi:transcriptional regulator with PAS, ATPase and Fis domain
VIAVSLAMQSLVEKLPRIARSGSSVLLHGESGTGKEVFALEIHRLSRFVGGPFVPVNCAAIPAALFESELFGHCRGAFTGADRDRDGLIDQANGGTLFLDEISELPQQMQAKLLRVLQDAQFLRVGENLPRSASFRLIAATNRDLRKLDHEGGLRSDLYYRIAVIELKLPPLRERREDIEELCIEFAHEFGRGAAPRFSARCREALTSYDWPGNVRELRNAIEHACVLADGAMLDLEHLPVALQRFAAANASATARDKRARGNRTQAAALLGITRRALGYRIQKHELVTPLGDTVSGVAPNNALTQRGAPPDPGDGEA